MTIKYNITNFAIDFFCLKLYIIYIMAERTPATTIRLNWMDRIINVFDPVGGMRRLQARAAISFLDTNGYITPGGMRRAVRGWTPTANSVDQDTIQKVASSRAGCRDLVMNTPVARAALKRELTNVVGWGLNLQSRINRKFLGMTPEEAGVWERNTEREFRMWAESVKCDAEMSNTFYELQGLALYNTSLSGDVFVLLPSIPRPGMPYDLRVKLIEADLCCNPNGQMDTVRIAGGVEVDDNGAPIKYHFRKVDPNATLAMAYKGNTWTAVDAYGAQSGRRNILHLLHRERPGQKRGMPMLAPVVEILKQVSRLAEAELMSSVIASFFTVFVKTNPATGGLANGFVPDDKVADPDQTNIPGDETTYEMGSGNIIELPNEGQSIEIADPKRPNGAFEPFFQAMVKQIGAAIEIPYEQLMLYFSASYSAARGAILEAWKFYRHRRIWLARKFCQPIFEEWLTEAVLRGRIAAPGFFDDPAMRQAWCGAVWSGPGQGQLSPKEESEAAFYRIEKLLSTYEDEYAAIHGTDWESGLHRNARERQLITDAGLEMPTSSASLASVGGFGETPAPTSKKQPVQKEEE